MRMTHGVWFYYDMEEEAVALSIDGVKRGLFDLEAAQALCDALDSHLLPDHEHCTTAQEQAWNSLNDAISIMKKLEK